MSIAVEAGGVGAVLAGAASGSVALQSDLPVQLGVIGAYLVVALVVGLVAFFVRLVVILALMLFQLAQHNGRENFSPFREEADLVINNNHDFKSGLDVLKAVIKTKNPGKQSQN